MRRRDFIRHMARTSAAATVAVAGGVLLHDRRDGRRYFADQREAGGVRLPSYRVSRPEGAVELVIARGQQADAGTLARAAVAAMGGMESFVAPGDVVLLKPNVAFDRPAALGATTHPDVLAAVGQLCRDAGARRILVTDNPINQPEGCFYKSGIQHATSGFGGEVALPRASSFAPLQIHGQVLQTWPVLYTPLAHADKVIGIAPCKDHNLCRASMCMKNWYGLLGGRRNQFHQQIHGIISDFPHMIQPTLVILDATRMLVRNGPTGGSLADVARGHTVVAGTDMVAVDTIGAGLLGRTLDEVQYLRRAQDRGLGTTEWKNLVYREVQAG